MTEKRQREKKKSSLFLSKKVNDPEVGQPRNALPRGQSIEGYETTPPGSRKVKPLRIIEMAQQYKKGKRKKTKTKQNYMHSKNFIESNDQENTILRTLKCGTIGNSVPSFTTIITFCGVETPTSIIIIVTAKTIRSVSATPTPLLAKIAGGSCWRWKG